MITHGRIERIRRGLSKWLVRLVPLKLLGGRKSSLALERLGNGDGAWTVPKKDLTPGAVCYCIGIGCNASFDLALADRSSTQVHSFDPTPSSIEYMNRNPEWPINFHSQAEQIPKIAKVRIRFTFSLSQFRTNTSSKIPILALNRY